MIAALAIVLAIMAAFATLATIIQTCYLESMRLRPREYRTLMVFEEAVEKSLVVTVETGALAFSLWKHTLLVLMPLVLFGITESVGEAAVFAVLAMMGTAYLLPQFVYRRSNGRWLIRILFLLKGMVLAARPVIATFRAMKSVAELAQDDHKPDENGSDEIEALIEAGAEEGLIEEGDKKLIQTVIAFGDKTVREVMTPRGQIVAIADDKTLEELRQLVINEQFSRIPVYRSALDNIVGFVHVRDMFEVEQQQRMKRKVREVMREIGAVPETKPVDRLLREMQRDGKHMVVVVDEYGQTAGIATMEDLVEEILGEIRDEHEPALDVEKQPDGSFVVSGSYDVDHMSDLVEFRPSESVEATTIGGLVTEWMGHVPQAGEFVERDGIRIDVLAASELRVDRVRLSRTSMKAVEAKGNRDV